MNSGAIERLRMIPDSVLSSESLTASATVLYAAILVWNPGDGSGCSLGLKKIAQLLGKSEKTVKRRLKELKDAGLVTVKCPGLGRNALISVLQALDRSDVTYLEGSEMNGQH